MDFGQRNKVSPQGNMSSMTDLVFLLLVFFIILSTRVVNGEQVELPETSSDPADAGKATITITADNRIQLNNKPVTEEDLPRKLNALYFNTSDEEKKVVILNADRAAEFGIAIEIMDIVDELGYKVAVATKDKK